MIKAAGSILALFLAAVPQASPPRERVHFNRDIRPILWDTCLKCHGPDVDNNGSDLRLDTREGALADLGDGRRAVVPGKPQESELYRRLTTSDRSDRMPPAKSGKSLTAAQIELFRRWIEEGAEYQGHWAYLPPVKSPPPAVKTAGWARTAVDAFLLARLEKEGLRPSPEADRTTLLRRLSLDLTGLPPTPEEADAFEADRDPHAYEKQVDRLLASPAYGERMAVAWLDAVRYADSRGYHSDNPRNVSSYRDYVIAAFNENMPYDRFTREQLAGDLLENPTLSQRVASGYNKLNQTTEEGGAQAKEYAAKTAADRVRNVSTVWMGATLGCAECHDHKFDPYTAKDFYRFAAFFADVQEPAIKDPDKGIAVPTEAQAAELAAMDAEAARLRKALETSTPELEAARRAWEPAAIAAAPWTARTPRALKSAGNADFRVEEDASILVLRSPAKDAHTVEIQAGKGTTAVRLDVWRDGTRKGAGPGLADNGNFVLTRFRAKAGGKDVAVARATASWEQDGWPAAAALDGRNNKGWAVLPQTGRDHEIVFELKQPLEADGLLTLQLDYQSPFAEHVPARFRLSTSTAEPEALAPVPLDVRGILAKPEAERSPAEAARLSAHFRAVTPRLRKEREALAKAEQRRDAFEKSLRRSLVSMSGAPRTVRLLKRGNWMDDSGEAVEPGTPGFLPSLGVQGRRATRLDLADWLCSKENPLTARTFVNRLWRRFFGNGLSKVLDDLGGQGEWPSHPELLDWLAVEFTDSGWDVKRMVRLLVTSAAYRQSSRPTAELRQRDPYNRLVARQSRFRIDAEFVRDGALVASGLLAQAVGGESVRPYQPAGYWAHLNFPKREWMNDAGPGLWRRGLYTWWQRSFLHPSLLAFDAPSREEACVERPRSNIPQQALVLLNDPTYVEAARALAARALKEGGADDPSRLAWMFRRAVTRRPHADETQVLAELLARHLAHYRAEPETAEALLKVGQAGRPKDVPATDLAAWTSVARAVLNLHESITRY